MDSQNNQQIDINNLNEKEALYVVWQMLIKAQGKGIYSIDESCAIKAAVQKITDKLIPKE